MLIDAGVQCTKGVREFQNKNTPKLYLTLQYMTMKQ